MAARHSRKDSSNYPIAFRLMFITALVVTVKGDCGPPTVKDNAELSKKHEGQVNFPAGSSVHYICSPGYMKIPGKLSTTTCLEGSKWSLIPEFCQPRTCGSPGEINNGWYNLTAGTTYGSKATFGCDKGYKIVGARPYRHCLGTGSWSNDVPVCEPVLCQDPPDIANGIHSGMSVDTFTYLTGVTYKCITGSIIGEASMYCTEHGNWSEPPPTCIDVTCPRPNVNNGRMAAGFGSQFTYGDQVTFQCNQGFHLKGDSVIRCLEDGAWHPPIPVCVTKVRCPRPNVINGIMTPASGSRFSNGDQVVFKCIPGLTLLGSTVIECQDNGTWRPPIPVCAVPCPEPKVANGKITGRSRIQTTVQTAYIASETVTFQCDDGYRMNSGRVARCETNSEWSSLPSCNPVTCYAPKVTNGKITPGNGGHTSVKTSYRFSETVTIRCEDGYTMNGRNVSQCEADGMWSALPTCEPEVFSHQSKYTPGQAIKNTGHKGEEIGIASQCPVRLMPLGTQNLTCVDADSLGRDLHKDTAIPGHAGVLCGFVGRSVTENWEAMNLDDKYTHLEMSKLCLDVRSLHLQIEKLNVKNVPCQPTAEPV